MRAVKEAYVEPVSDRKLMDSALRGLLAGLDPHSEYLDSSGLTELDEQTSGNYAGLGVEVVVADGALRVITPIDDSPASRAGIKPGDIITRIDGSLITADNANDSIERLRGTPGSKIALTLRREGQDSPLELALKRELIKVASVKANLLEPGYAYVRVAQFQEETGAELRDKLRRLQQGKPLRGLVLDLRSNPGGIINAAVEVSDAFLDDGVIVSTRGRIKESEANYTATRGDLINGAPLVVLVDGGTASAAEIVAGALQDHRRGLIVGNRTFGKGSVQTVLPLDDKHAVKLTTARYFTPNGTSIQATGIKPDIALADLRLAKPDAPATAQLSERDLIGHLRGERESTKDEQVQRDASVDADFALNEALNVLKGLVLAHDRSQPKAAKG
jgi:carboxyl-terminal processing protease